MASPQLAEPCRGGAPRDHRGRRTAQSARACSTPRAAACVAGHASGLQRRGIFLRDGATTTMPVAVHAALATGLTLDEPSTRSFYRSWVSRRTAAGSSPGWSRPRARGWSPPSPGARVPDTLASLMEQTPPPASGGGPGGREAWTYEGGAAARRLSRRRRPSGEAPSTATSSSIASATVAWASCMRRTIRGSTARSRSSCSPDRGARASVCCARRRPWRACRIPTSWSRTTSGHFARARVPRDGARRRRRPSPVAGRRSRGSARILDVFIAAGRGLAAAHASGIVHRDFKPDNVLIGATAACA